MCHLLNLTRSVYFAWQSWPPSARFVENQRLGMENIEARRSMKYFTKMVIKSTANGLFDRCVKLDFRLSIVRRLSRTSRHCKVEYQRYLLQQNFSADGPNRVWLPDIMYIYTEEGWLYLTTIEDMWSQRMVGHSITDHLQSIAVAGRETAMTMRWLSCSLRRLKKVMWSGSAFIREEKADELF
jgi:putative transposase